MSLNNVKCAALGDKKPPLSAKKTQDPNIIQSIKQMTLQNILSNLNESKSFQNPQSPDSHKKINTRMQSAKDMGKVLVFEREPSRFIEIRDQQQVLTDFEAIAYPNHAYDDVPVICEGCWCFTSEKNEENLIQCKACNACLHKQCLVSETGAEETTKYFINDFCLRCYNILINDFAVDTIKCVFCPLLTGLMVPFYGEYWGHILCLRYFKLFNHLDKKRNNVFMDKYLQDLLDNPSFCNTCKIKEGFCVQCLKVTCTLKTHISCGLRKGLIRPSEMQDLPDMNYMKFLNIKFLCAGHCSEKIKSSFLRQKFHNMMSYKPKITVESFKFLSQEDLYKMGLLTNKLTPISKTAKLKSFSKEITKPSNTKSFSKEILKSTRSSSNKSTEPLVLKKSFSKIMKIDREISFHDMEKLRGLISAYIKSHGLHENLPSKGVNFTKCTELHSVFDEPKFVSQKNLWKYLERNIFEKSSFKRLMSLRRQRPTRLPSSRRRVISPLTLISGNRPISLEKNLREYSPSPPRTSSLMRKRHKRLRPHKISRSRSRFNSKSISRSIPISSVSSLSESLVKSPLKSQTSRSESPDGSSSESELFRSDHKTRSFSQSPPPPVKRKYKKTSCKNEHKLSGKTVTITELLNLQQNSKEVLNNHEENIDEEISPHVSEKEIEMRRQINEVRVRKIIARIDAPGYSINRKHDMSNVYNSRLDEGITYYRDIENKAEREDVFEDLMGDLFQHPASNNTQQVNNKNNELEINKKIPVMIVVPEEGDKAKKSVEKPQNKLPAYEFSKKINENKEDWLEKRWCLSRKPFQSRHIINSVLLKCLENSHNEKDVGNIGRHFCMLKYC